MRRLTTTSGSDSSRAAIGASGRLGAARDGGEQAGVSVATQPTGGLAVEPADASGLATPARKIVCVMGVGRSGTSVLTEGLHRLGLRISEDLVPASDQNPRGAWEDRDIIALSREIYGALNVTPFEALPADWTQTAAYRLAVAKLRRILVSRFVDDDAPLVIKDPSISVFLPVWQAACNAEKILPSYVFCTRNPAETLGSLVNTYRVSREKAESIWLLRTVSAILGTTARLCVVDYSELIARRSDPFTRVFKAAELRAKKGPARAFPAGLVRDDLNRSSLDPIQPENPLIPILSARLEQFRRGEIDRDAIYQAAREADATIASFRWWSEEASRSRAHQRERTEERTAAIEGARDRERAQAAEALAAAAATHQDALNQEQKRVREAVDALGRERKRAAEALAGSAARHQDALNQEQKRATEAVDALGRERKRAAEALTAAAARHEDALGREREQAARVLAATEEALVVMKQSFERERATAAKALDDAEKRRVLMEQSFDRRLAEAARALNEAEQRRAATEVIHDDRLAKSAKSLEEAARRHAAIEQSFSQQLADIAKVLRETEERRVRFRLRQAIELIRPAWRLTWLPKGKI